MTDKPPTIFGVPMRPVIHGPQCWHMGSSIWLCPGGECWEWEIRLGKLGGLIEFGSCLNRRSATKAIERAIARIREEARRLGT
jgi:hypothetical protein